MNTEELRIPEHVAIILDGNRRWAKKRGMSAQEGHKAGFDNLTELTEYVLNRGVKVLSVYAFSTENFKREKKEVDFLMNLFVQGFKKYCSRCMKNNIKIVFSGRGEPLPKKVMDVMDDVSEKTKDNTGGIFNVCLNYGGHAEIVDTSKKLASMVKKGELEIENITEEMFEKNLYNDLPPVDLMIRTSGEVRLSNFLLWQNAYAEFYFPDVEFPAFNGEEFEKAILAYNGRHRRFGGN